MLAAELDEPPNPDEVADHLLAVQRQHPALTGRVQAGAALDLAALGSTPFDDDGLVRVAVDGRQVAVAGHHVVIDGLGLLALLCSLTGVTATSSARGLTASGTSRPLLSVAAASRATELVLRRPAVVAATGRRQSGPDILVSCGVAGSVRLADLVVAARDGVVWWNRDHRGRTSPISVAIGASRRSGAAAITPTDDSAYLRLADVAGRNAAEIANEIGASPAQLAPSKAGRKRLVTAAMSQVSRFRGSTVLISHLGRIKSEGIVEMQFFPVAGGASGLSIGAATVGANTQVTLRGRAGRHSPRDLQHLLSAITSRLPG